MISTYQIKGDLLASLLNDRALLSVIIVGQLIAISLTFSPLYKNEPWLILAPVSLFIHIVSLCSLSTIHLLKKPLAKSSFRQQLAVMILLVCCYTLIASFVVFSLELISALSLYEFILRNLLISFIIAVLYAQFSIIHAEQSAIKNQATKAQLNYLQARIRPHFLFNSLNMSAELVYHNPEDAEKTILAIAALSRAAMYGDENILLEKEIDLAKQYVLVESWRFGEKLTVKWCIPDDIPKIKVPALTLQPLLENAITHGVEPNPEPSLVEVQVKVTAQSVTFIIDNPFVGESANTKRPSNGIAVDNIKERLAMTLGHRASLSHHITDNVYRTKMVIPR